jgi:hypothetical protein
MKTAAAITALAVVGSFAVGQGVRLPVAPDSPISPASNLPLMNGLPIRPTGDLPAQHGSLQLGADCPPIEQAIWFSPFPHLVECAFDAPNNYRLLSARSPTNADVNGDGSEDHFFSTAMTITVVQNGQPLSDPNSPLALVHNWTLHQDGVTKARFAAVNLIGPQLGAWCLDNIPGSADAVCVILHLFTPTLGWSGWRDMDGDGDLDFLCLIEGCNGTFRRQIWFENIGYEQSPPPLAADLNADGYINGIDLGLLLGQWGAVNQ